MCGIFCVGKSWPPVNRTAVCLGSLNARRLCLVLIGVVNRGCLKSAC